MFMTHNEWNMCFIVLNLNSEQFFAKFRIFQFTCPRASSCASSIAKLI